MLVEFSNQLSGTTNLLSQISRLENVVTGTTIFTSLCNNSYNAAITGLCSTSGQIKSLDNPLFPPNVFKLVFGENASQSNLTIVINKNDLIGLSPSFDNTAESLLVGILVKLLINQKIMFAGKLNFEYWGYGFIDDKKVDTILIKAYSLLSTTDTYEIANYNNQVSPNNY